eukprot:maker-scaffold48_size466083-snap-gene-3.27 protein:Tk05987 transcript:maker-scaffold48_size466083-snap-gene-3.27-mRNA-1 annotation:"major facilitator superfamily domain-containing protein 8"
MENLNDLTIRNETLKKHKHLKLLGFTFQSNLGWNQQFASLVADLNEVPHSRRSTMATDNRARLRSLFIVHTSMLILALGSSIIYTGLYPYLQLLDPSVRLDEYGFVVASDALAQMIFSPIFGIIADKMGSIRVVAIICALTFFGGNVIFSLISLIPREIAGLAKPRVWGLLVARFVVGTGTAINAAARAYVSKVTTMSERTTHVALLSLFQTLGFILGPALQSALTPIGEKEISGDSVVVFDMYTATGWVSAINGALALVMFMPGIFVEFHEAPKEESTKAVDAEEPKALEGPADSGENKAGDVGSPKPLPKAVRQMRDQPRELLKQFSRISILDGQNFNVMEDKPDDNEPKTKVNTIAALISTWGFFSFFCSFVLLETLVSPMAIDQFGWNQEDTILYLGITMAAGGALAAFCFGAIGPLSKRFDERILLIAIGIIPMIIGRIVMMPMGTERPPFRGNKTDCDNYDPSTDGFEYFDERAVIDDLVGCPYCWCLDIPRMTVTQFLIGYAISVTGYPFCVAISGSLFSKILGNSPQGFWMGILTMAGSCARVIGPILFTWIYEQYGTYLTFAIIGATLVVSLVLYAVGYKQFEIKAS